MPKNVAIYTLFGGKIENFKNLISEKHLINSMSAETERFSVVSTTLKCVELTHRGSCEGWLWLAMVSN